MAGSLAGRSLFPVPPACFSLGFAGDGSVRTSPNRLQAFNSTSGKSAPLRVINLVTFSIVFYWLRKCLLRMVAIEPFLTLGKASLQVFCTHLAFVFVGLALLVRDVGEDVDAPSEQLHGLPAYTLLVLTFTGLILVAVHEVRRRRVRRRQNLAVNSTT